MQSNGGACQMLSLLTPIGYQSGDCGYCKKEDSSASYYARARSLCPEDYQKLVDRGWRRSGHLLYIPDAYRSCCPHYPIRLPAADFKPGRDHRQALNRWNRFILGEKYQKEVSKKYPKTKAEKKKENTFDLLSTLHEAESASLKPDIKPEHTFKVTLEHDTFSEEKFALFSNYQQHVHHESPAEVTRDGFKRFLCSSPLHRHPDADGKPLGSYHQCYRVDGRLIAMAVLDLLPHAVSGVYFLYHSDYEKWSFGKLSALREASLALEQGYQFYYMGYYIHSCQKMRYKGEYKPQYLLDYESGDWELLNDEMRNLLDEKKYVSMSKERAAKSANGQDRRAEFTTPAASADVDEAEYLHPEPLAAMTSGLSLFQLRMPGVQTLPQILETTDLDAMALTIGRGLHEMQDLVSWDSGSADDGQSTKAHIAEFAACIGPEVARGIVVDLGRG